MDVVWCGMMVAIDGGMGDDHDDGRWRRRGGRSVRVSVSMAMSLGKRVVMSHATLRSRVNGKRAVKVVANMSPTPMKRVLVTGASGR